jgi:hypothetical protein
MEPVKGNNGEGYERMVCDVYVVPHALQAGILLPEMRTDPPFLLLLL